MREGTGMTTPIIYIMLIFIGLFIILEASPLLKQNMIKELIAASLLLLLALSYGTDLAMDWMRLPNPRALIAVVKPISQAFEKTLEVHQ